MYLLQAHDKHRSVVLGEDRRLDLVEKVVTSVIRGSPASVGIRVAGAYGADGGSLLREVVEERRVQLECLHALEAELEVLQHIDQPLAVD